MFTEPEEAPVAGTGRGRGKVARDGVEAWEELGFCVAWEGKPLEDFSGRSAVASAFHA